MSKTSNKKINIQNREKQFLKIAAKYANSPLLEDVKLLYMNNEIKTIRGAESNLNKPIKLKKDGTPYAGTIKRLANIKNKVEAVKNKVQYQKIKLGDSVIKNITNNNINTYSFNKDHIGEISRLKKLGGTDTVIKQTINYYINNELINSDEIEAKQAITGKYKKRLYTTIKNTVSPDYENKIYHWIDKNNPTNSDFTKGKIYTVKIINDTLKKVKKENLKPIKQTFKNDVLNACLFNGCLKFFKDSEDKRKTATYNRLIKNSSEYAKPYEEEEIYKICNLTESNILIKDVFNMETKIYKPTEKRARYNVNLINSRFNHVEYMNGNNEEAQEVENLEAYEKIKKDALYYVEAYGEIKTLNGNYKIKDSYFSIIWKEWKEKNNYNKLLIDTQAPEMDLINHYKYSTNHFINNDFIKDDKLYIELDIKKAYYNFKDFKNYEGLPSSDFINCKCSEKFTFNTFNEQNKNGLIGYYEIEILKIKEDKKKLFNILGFIECKKYVLTTAQIKTLSPFIEFKFLNYSISQKVKLSFGDDFLIDKDNEKNPKPYARAVGLMLHKEPYLNYTIKTDKETISETIRANLSDDKTNKYDYYILENEGIIKINEIKKIIKCGDHMAKYIHSLITTQIIEQLLNVEDIENNFIGVKLDSIILKKDATYKILETFKIKEANIKTMFKNNEDNGYFTPYFENIGYREHKKRYNLNLDEIEEDDEEEGEITNFKPSFLPEGEDIINNKIVCRGKGGAGKSAAVLNFFSSVCVVSSCWNLSEAFKLEFPNIRNLSINKTLGEQCEKVEIKESVIFCDELTMWDAEQVKKLISLYPNKIIILCGDIDFNGVYFQLDSGFNTVLNLDDIAGNFQVVKYIKNYRFDDDLNLILDDMRNINNKKELIRYTREKFKFKKLEDINFNSPFIGLTDTHEDGGKKSEYIENNFKDVEKNYFVAKTNFNKNEFKGARVEDITKTNNYELKFFHTCHSFQGQTIKNKDLIISITDFIKYEFNHLKRLIYTAASRAKTREQIIFIDNDY